MTIPAQNSGAPNIDNLIPRGKTIETDLFRDKLLKILYSQAEVLPASSSPLGRLWKLVNSSNSMLEDCSDTIKLDPALTTRVFRVANSAAQAGNGPASNLEAAVMRIGFTQLRELVFNSGVLDQFSKLTLPPGWEQFWLRNILVARITERISSQFFRTNGTEYLAGLLHDSGLVFLASFFPAEFMKIFYGETSYLVMEKQVLPVGHAGISAAICARSLLPLRVVNAVYNHHHPMLLEGQNIKTAGQSAQFLGTILNVADRIADHCELGIGDSPNLSLEEIAQTPECQWLLNFGPIDLGLIMADELPKAEETFGIFWPKSPSLVSASE